MTIGPRRSGVPPYVAPLSVRLEMKRAHRAQIFDAAGARVTEPGVFDRDAADAAWIKAVEAAGVAKAERTDKTAAKTVETHGAPAPSSCATPVLLIRNAGNKNWFAAGIQKFEQ